MTTKGITLIFLVFNLYTSLFSQESTKPLTDSEIVRHVSVMDIEGKKYENVKVTLKSISPDYFFSEKHKVKISIVDGDGNKILKKSLKNVFLYVFSNGQVQVGRPNFNKIIIEKMEAGSFLGMIREKEGIY